MQIHRYPCALVIVGMLVLFLPGCGGGDGDGGPPVGPDLNGAWTGNFYIQNGGGDDNEAVTATIRHIGDAVIIQTSRTGIAANLTGTISADGSLRLTDAFDGEIWTSFYRDATASRVQVADFVRPPEINDPNPIRILDLRR